MGRSNCGKSTLINKVFNSKKVARKAKSPGTTCFLHMHRFKFEGNFYKIVDTPGYGYANMNKRRRMLWYSLIEEYLKISTRLSQIFLFLNFEHGLKSSDKEVLQTIDKFNIPIQPVLTKCDKIP